MANDESGQGSVATAPTPEPLGFDQRKHESPLERIQQPDIDLSNLDDLRGTLKLIQESGSL